MWKYLTVNFLWFAILFLVHFVGSSKDKKIVFVAMMALAVYLAAKSTMDPFVWFYYVLFSILVFYGSGQFKNWVFIKSIALEEDIQISNRAFEEEKKMLNEKTWDAEILDRKANEIIGLYEKVKEMSKSLDRFENFLIFGESLAENFQFRSLKIIFVSEQGFGLGYPEEVYELTYADFHGFFDRGILMKNRNKLQSTLFPLDMKILTHVLKTGKPIFDEDPKEIFYGENVGRQPGFVAYPMFVDRKIFSILVIFGLSMKESKLPQILVERFISEMERIKLYERVEMLAITDGLTGVYVRRHLMERLEGEIDRCRRFNFKLSFLMIDIDHFKNFNDSYGHLVGDVVLKQVAESIRASVREVDLVGRYGGEEFGVLLVETDPSMAFQIAERIRRSIEEKNFKAYDEKLTVTVSVGCSNLSAEINDAHLLVESADSVLYQAKRQGRNRVVSMI